MINFMHDQYSLDQYYFLHEEIKLLPNLIYFGQFNLIIICFVNLNWKLIFELLTFDYSIFCIFFAFDNTFL